MINVTYDQEVDAKYVSIKEGTIHETKIINDWLFLDVDNVGSIVGIEVLDSSKNDIEVYSFDGEVTHIGFSQKRENGETFKEDFDLKFNYVPGDAMLA